MGGISHRQIQQCPDIWKDLTRRKPWRTLKILRNKYESSEKSWIVSYMVPVAVDDLGSRRAAEKPEGDGQTNSCDRVARNSEKNIRNEYARHGGCS